MTELAITYRGTVYPWQCDHMGHMNVMWYSGKFDEASWQLLSILGLTGSHFRERGVGMVALEQHIEYKRELHAGDTITIRSRVSDVNDKTLTMVHEMRNDQTGEIAAKTAIVGLHIDSSSRRALSLPADVRARAQMLIIQETGNTRTGAEAPVQMSHGSDSASLRTERTKPASPLFV